MFACALASLEIGKATWQRSMTFALGLGFDSHANRNLDIPFRDLKLDSMSSLEISITIRSVDLLLDTSLVLHFHRKPGRPEPCAALFLTSKTCNFARMRTARRFFLFEFSEITQVTILLACYLFLSFSIHTRRLRLRYEESWPALLFFLLHKGSWT